jgi:hypothetical protein
MFQQHSRSCFITAENLREVMCLNKKHLYTKSNHDVALQINFYGNSNFTENRSLLSNCQTVKCLNLAKWEISTSAFITHLKFYVYTYREVLDEMWCHSRFNYLISVVLHHNVINTELTNSVLSQSVHLERCANRH